MQGQMTYAKAKKLNAIFLLLLLATDPNASYGDEFNSDHQGHSSGHARSPEYFDEKMKEFERNKYRF